MWSAGPNTFLHFLSFQIKRYIICRKSCSFQTQVLWWHTICSLTCITMFTTVSPVILPVTSAIYSVIPNLLLQTVLKALIHLQTTEYNTLRRSASSEAPRGTAWTCSCLTEWMLWNTVRRALRMVETGSTQADLVPGSSMSQQHHGSLCTLNTYPGDSQKPLEYGTKTHSEKQCTFNLWCCGSPKQKKRKGELWRRGCLCDPLALWERVQWKNCPHC